MRVLFASLLVTATLAAEPRLRIIEDPALWQAMIRKLSGPEAVASPGTTPWTTLIRSRAPRWESEIPALAAAYAPVAAPDAATIVIGNGGGQDAFTHDATTIGFDVARLQAEYGDAALAENTNRIDRFFRHEYTHLLQKAWLREHPYDAGTPLRAALLGIWTEGLGNYHSLSERWRGRSESGLEARFVATLAALACASEEDARKLTSDLSMGRFDRKWGALPVALWLDADQNAIRELILAGPDGVWSLAERHLPDGSRAILREARAAAAVCEH
jgi:hypothetical protein